MPLPPNVFYHVIGDAINPVTGEIKRIDGTYGSLWGEGGAVQLALEMDAAGMTWQDVEMVSVTRDTDASPLTEDY